MTDYRELAEFVGVVARKVGSRIREARQSEEFNIRQKGLRDLVTEIDIWADREITTAITGRYPGDIVIAEESAAELARKSGKSLQELSLSGRAWIVDPLDGTSNFSKRLPHSSVSIGLLERGVRVFGLVFDPYRDELFQATLNGGAFLNGQPIHVSKESEKIQALIATGIPNDEKVLENFYRVHRAIGDCCHTIRMLGSAAIDLCWVACGRLEGSFAYNLKPWDVAAGSLIVEEAGGMIGSFTEESLSGYSVFDRSTFAANNNLFFPLRELAWNAHNMPF